MKRTKFILAILAILIFLSLSVSGQPDDEHVKHYNLNLSWDEGNFSLNSYKVDFSRDMPSNVEGLYSADVLDYRGNVVNSTFFAFSNEIVYDQINENGTIVSGGTLDLNEINFSIYVPYYENASEIVIYDPNITEKLRIDVGKYSKEGFSRDSLQKEDNESQEGNESGGIVGNETRDPGRENFEDLARDYWWVLVVVLVLLVVYLVWSLKKES